MFGKCHEWRSRNIAVEAAGGEWSFAGNIFSRTLIEHSPIIYLGTEGHLFGHEDEREICDDELADRQRDGSIKKNTNWHYDDLYVHRKEKKNSIFLFIEFQRNVDAILLHLHVFTSHRQLHYTCVLCMAWPFNGIPYNMFDVFADVNVIVTCYIIRRYRHVCWICLAKHLRGRQKWLKLTTFSKRFVSVSSIVFLWFALCGGSHIHSLAKNALSAQRAQAAEILERKKGFIY